MLFSVTSLGISGLYYLCGFMCAGSSTYGIMFCIAPRTLPGLPSLKGFGLSLECRVIFKMCILKADPARNMNLAAGPDPSQSPICNRHV